MAQIPQFTAPEANFPLGKISAPADTTAIDHVSQVAMQMADEQTKKNALDDAEKAQYASKNEDGTPKAVAEDTGLFGIPTTYSSTYNKAANIAYVESKKTQLTAGTAELQQKYQYDPAEFTKQLATFRQTYMTGVPTNLLPHLDQLYQQHAAAATLRVNGIQQDTLFQQNKATIIKQIEDQQNALGNMILGDPNASKPETQDAALALASLFKASSEPTAADPSKGTYAGPPVIDPVTQVAQRDKILETVAQASLEGRYKQLPSFSERKAFVDSIGRGEFKIPSLHGLNDSGSAQVSAATAIRFGKELTVKLHQDQAQLQGQVRQQVADEVTNIAATGKGIYPNLGKSIAAAFPASGEFAATDESGASIKASVFQQKINDAKIAFEARKSISTNSPDEDAAAIASLEPKLGVGAAQDAASKGPLQAAVIKAVQDKWTAFHGSHEDPSKADPAYWIENNIPGVRELRVDGSPEGVQKYMATQRYWQEYNGLRPDQQRLMPKEAIYQAASILHDAGTNDPAKVQQKLSEMATQYGPYWPQVHAQLVRDGKMNDVTQVLAITNRPQDAVVAKTLAGANAVGETKLTEALGNEKTKAVRDSVVSELEGFNRTAAASGGGAPLIDVMSKSAKLVAYQYTLGGMAPEAAAKKAVQELVSSRYDISDSGTYRTPKGYAVATSIVADDAMEKIKPEDLALAKPDPQDTRTEAQRQALLAQQAKRGTWVTTAEDDGIQLLYPDKSPVLKADGHPLRIDFADVDPHMKQPPAGVDYGSDPMGAGWNGGAPPVKPIVPTKDNSYVVETTIDGRVASSTIIPAHDANGKRMTMPEAVDAWRKSHPGTVVGDDDNAESDRKLIEEMNARDKAEAEGKTVNKPGATEDVPAENIPYPKPKPEVVPEAFTTLADGSRIQLHKNDSDLTSNGIRFRDDPATYTSPYLRGIPSATPDAADGGVLYHLPDGYDKMSKEELLGEVSKMVKQQDAQSALLKKFHEKQSEGVWKFPDPPTKDDTQFEIRTYLENEAGHGTRDKVINEFLKRHLQKRSDAGDDGEYKVAGDSYGPGFLVRIPRPEDVQQQQLIKNNAIKGNRFVIDPLTGRLPPGAPPIVPSGKKVG